MAARPKFDLSAPLSDVSGPNTDREQIDYISMDLIDDDPGNFYQLTGLEELAANISMCGLQQPIRVRQHPDAAGRYMIVSGHRRRAAVKLLAQDDPNRWGEIPCIIERSSGSPSLQQLRLIYANSNTRALTPAELGEQALQVEKLLYQLQEEGYEFPGRMRDHVAKAVNASTTKLARLKMIREHLAQCWWAAWKKSELAESTAYELSRMPSDWQQLIFGAYGDKPNSLYEGTVKEFSRRFEQISAAGCGTKKDIVCTHKTTMMLKSSNDRWKYPCAALCCLKCESLQSCRTPCSRSVGKQKQLKESTKAERAEHKALQEAEDAPKIEQLKTLWRRFSAARKAADASLKDTFGYAKIYFHEKDEKDILDRENCTAKFTKETPTPYGTNFYLWEIQRLIDVADFLNCSLDYLLGRSEDIRPAAGWQTGTPQKAGQYVARVQFDQGARIATREMSWDGEWLMHGTAIDSSATVVCWIELPEGE